MEYTKSNLCQLPQLGLSCVGCCGGALKDKNQILEDIKKNTLELAHHRKLKDFINRAKPNELRDSGICRNITFIGYDKTSGNVLVGCPAHPELNQETEDDREFHCDIMHLCKTTEMFEKWDDKKRMSFIDFLKKKVKGGMDWFEYSIKMDNDDFLKEFEAQYGKQNISILNRIGLTKK